MAHYAFINSNNKVTEVITGMMKIKLMTYLMDLILGKPGMQTSEEKPVKELLTIH